MFIPQKKIDIPNTPEIDYYPNFFSKEKSHLYFEKLLQELTFHSETYSFGGQSIKTKRQMSYHSQYDYSYSKQNYRGKNWTPTLIELKDLIEYQTGFEFNAVLCNYYEDGLAGMGWHADKEKELGINPVIASLSLGQKRRFAFRHRVDIVNEKNPPKISEYLLNSGDLLIMKGNTQQYFEHCLIKDKSAKLPRLNLTFRKIV